MDLSVPPLVAYALAWFGFMGGIWALFDRAETVASTDTNVAISTWLRNLDVAEALGNWPAQFGWVFDHVFGERHLSWRCFYRSCIASFTAVIVLTLVWAALQPNEFLAFFVYQDEPVWQAIGFLTVVILFNVIPDYFSLLETRYLIRWMAVRHSIPRIVVAICIDVVATLIIFLAGVSLVVLVLATPHQGSLTAGFAVTTDFMLLILELWPPIVSLHALEGGFVAIGIFLYSTFFTSVWVWLYAFAGAVLKLAGCLGVGISGFKKLLDIDEKPIRSLGFVSMLLVTVLFIVAPFVR